MRVKYWKQKAKCMGGASAAGIAAGLWPLRPPHRQIPTRAHRPASARCHRSIGRIDELTTLWAGEERRQQEGEGGGDSPGRRARRGRPTQETKQQPSLAVPGDSIAFLIGLASSPQFESCSSIPTLGSGRYDSPSSMSASATRLAAGNRSSLYSMPYHAIRLFVLLLTCIYHVAVGREASSALRIISHI